MTDDFVADDETLYRRIPQREGNFKLENGVYRVSSAAFGDRNLQPSVDRAKLKNNEPKNSQTDATDLVVSLLTEDVRYRTTETMPPRRILGTNESCQVDVVPDPVKDHTTLPDNPAHALIRAVPDFKSDEKTLFRKLTKALARLAQWEIAPS